MKKKLLSLLLATSMLCSMIPTAFAASDKAVDAAYNLNSLGLFNGVGTNADGTPNFDLDRTPTRHEAVTMLVAILGKGNEAQTECWVTPFTDVAEWAKPFVGYAYSNGLTSGTSATTYGGNQPVTAAQYLTFVLTALGYKNGTDFQWNKAWELSDKIGMTRGEYNEKTGNFTRGDVAIISNSALSTKLKNSDKTLLEVLMEHGLEVVPSSREGLSFDEVLRLAAENHSSYTGGNVEASMNIDRYAISDKALLTQAEMETLRTERPKTTVLSVEQAREDADLFFRTWKYTYPSYYFVGEELFAAAKEQVLIQLSKQTGTLTGEEFGDILYESLSFLQDNHSSIDGKDPVSHEDELYYVSYLDNTQVFAKDEAGYYQTHNGAKWYFTSSSNNNLRIEPTLLTSGKVVYCPMVLLPRSEKVETDQIILENEGKAKEITVRWIMNEDVSYRGRVDSQCSVKTSEEIYYLDYLTMHSDVGDVNDFLRTAKEAKQYKAVIFDLRHTQGWEHWQLVEWIKMFTGKTPAINEAFLTRNNALRTLRNYEGFESVALGRENSKTWYNRGRTTANTIPLLVLADKSVLSSIEEALIYLQTIENTVVVGSNSRGCSQGGSVQTYYLPHSGVQFAIGGFMKFQGEVKNIDGVGYEPDIWCNPSEALASALMFLQHYGLTNEQSVQRLYKELAPPADLRVLWHGNEILPGMAFGDIPDRGDDNVLVTVDGKHISDFTVKSESPETMNAEKVSGGKIRLTKVAPFDGKNVGLTIIYEGKEYGFYCND